MSERLTKLVILYHLHYNVLKPQDLECRKGTLEFLRRDKVEHFIQSSYLYYFFPR